MDTGQNICVVSEFTLETLSEGCRHEGKPSRTPDIIYDLTWDSKHQQLAECLDVDISTDIQTSGAEGKDGGSSCALVPTWIFLSLCVCISRRYDSRIGSSWNKYNMDLNKHMLFI